MEQTYKFKLSGCAIMPSALITDMLNNYVYLTACMYVCMYVCRFESYLNTVSEVMAFSGQVKRLQKAGCNSENGQEMALCLL